MSIVKELPRPTHLENIIDSDPFTLSFEVSPEGEIFIVINDKKWTFGRNPPGRIGGVTYFYLLYQMLHNRPEETNLLDTSNWSTEQKEEIARLLRSTSIPTDLVIRIGDRVMNPGRYPHRDIAPVILAKDLYELSEKLYTKQPGFYHHLGFHRYNEKEVVFYHIDGF